MKSFPPVLVLRHGRTEWNAIGRLQGLADSPLDRDGIAQAMHQREILNALDVSDHALLCSPLGRTRATARICFQDVPTQVQYDDRLREIGMGDWQGKLREEIHTGATDIFESENGLEFYRSIPNGETIDQVAARSAAFLDDLRGPTVVVTHGITSRILRCLLICEPADAFPDLPGGQGVVHEVTAGVHRTYK